MAEQFSMPSMFDTRYAMDRQMELDAQKAGQVGGGGKRYGMYYNSSLLGDRDNASLMSLTGMMGGQGDPRIQKQNAIDTVMQQYPNPSTAQDFKSIANALQAQGLYDESARAMKMSTDITASIPTVKDSKLGTVEIPTEKNGVRYTQRWNTVDGVPTTMLGEQRTDAPSTSSDKTVTQNGVVYWAGTGLPVIKGSEPDIKTFTQNGVVYNEKTLLPLIKGAAEDRATFVENGIAYYKDDGSRVTDAVIDKEKLLQGGVWRYTDTQLPVFDKIEPTLSENQQASKLYSDYLLANPAEFNTPIGKVELAKLLIQNNLSNSQTFTDLMQSIDQDGVNEIEREVVIQKGIERLSVNYVKSDVGKMDSILVPIEKQINEYMPHLLDVDGDFMYDRNGNALRDTSKGIPGWDTLKRYERYIGNSETVRAAKNFAEDAQLLLNTVIKQRSGSAVSIQEAERLTREYETGLSSSQSFANWVSAVRKFTETTRAEVVSGFSPEVQYGYFSQMGIYPTLYDPDNELKQLPPGAYWKDEAGNIRQKQQ